MTEGPGFARPRKLAAADAVREFRSGQPDLDEWIGRYALTNQQSGMATVFVSTAGARIAGFYSLATGAVEHADAAARVTKGVARHPIPVILLTRLAVDKRYQGAGLGRMLVRDALLRVNRAADEIGVRALLVHAKDERARDFYLRLAEFEPSPTDPLHLYLLMKDLRKAIVGNTKTHLSRLVDDVVDGESVVIAKAGSRVAKLVSLEAQPNHPRSLVGFLSGRISIPDDFDRMREAELVARFEGTGPAVSQ